MRALKLAAIACALALICGAAPRLIVIATAASGLSHPFAGMKAGVGRVATTGATPAAGSDAAAQQTAKPVKKDSLFVRVITAPFRGIAKLFRAGRDKRPRAARVKVEVTPKPPVTPAPATAVQAQKNVPRPEPATRVTPAAAAAVQPHPTTTQASTASAASPRQVSAATVEAGSASTAPAPQPVPAGPRSLPANEVAAQQQAAAPFVPLAVGVPRDPLSQGRALFERGYLNEAISELSIAAVTSANLAEANNLLGLAYDRQGRHKEAHEAYERALSSAPADPHVLNNLGHSLYLNGYYAAAIVRLRQAARLAPGNPHVLNNLALVYGRLRKYDEAFKHYTRAGGELYARLQTGALLDFAGRDRDAIKQFEAARRLDPASTEALRRLIPLYNRTGQRDKAEAAQQELDRPKTKSAATSS